MTARSLYVHHPLPETRSETVKKLETESWDKSLNCWETKLSENDNRKHTAPKHEEQELQYSVFVILYLPAPWFLLAHLWPSAPFLAPPAWRNLRSSGRLLALIRPFLPRVSKSPLIHHLFWFLERTDAVKLSRSTATTMFCHVWWC